MGKSTVAAMLRDLDVPVFDADAAVHELQGPRGALVPLIETAFPGTTGPQGVDRQKLGNAVFGNQEALSALERIVHPAVAALRGDFLRENAEAPLVVFDIPLLFEKGGDKGLDAIAVVSAPVAEQRARVLARRRAIRISAGTRPLHEAVDREHRPAARDIGQRGVQHWVVLIQGSDLRALRD